MDNDTAVSRGKQDGHEDYAVEWVPILDITPSPENDQIYGKILHDEAMENLIDSIRRKGLDEPILITEDCFILSGHRRYYAMGYLGRSYVPVRVKHGIRREDNEGYHRDLADYNPQRVKTVGSLLKEALLRNNDAADTYAAIEEREEASLHVDAEFMEVEGTKKVTPTGDRMLEFLAAAKGVISGNRKYWPLSLRKIHYGLVSLKKKPLTFTPKRSKFGAEKYRYKNTKECYAALGRLLTDARYCGEVSMTCIDDPTRPRKIYSDGYSSLNHFIHSEIFSFMRGFSRNHQDEQPRHIVVLGEKNTVYNMIGRACASYHVPYFIGRGFGSVPLWRDIARGFSDSGKKKMTLIVVSDFDPEGLELPDDAIRSLALFHDRDKIDGMRIAVTPKQIEELGLVEDFNPAKTESHLLARFEKRTGDTKTWEVEALPSDYLVEQIKAAIEANMDMEIYQNLRDQEERDCTELSVIRSTIASQMEF